jgi:hypothetical protein
MCLFNAILNYRKYAKTFLDLPMVSIFVHYGVGTSKELTQRIRGLDALRKIKAPMVLTPNGYMPNLQSRFFTEDIRMV